MKWLTGLLLVAVIVEGLALVSLHSRLGRNERRVNEEHAGDGLASPAMAAPSNARIQQLDERITRVEDQVTDASVALAQLRRAGPEEQGPDGRVAVSPPAIDRGKVPAPTDWATVIAPDLARVLIERGLTPYDPAVGEHVRHAGDAWRKADDDQRAEMRAVLDAMERNSITQDAFRVQSKAIDRKWKDTRRAIVDELVKALDGDS